MLEVSRVNVAYAGLQVIWDVSFIVGDGDIVALVGANGAGKTTLAMTLSGLVRPTSGSVVFNGVRLDRCPAHHIIRLGVVHVPEGRRLFPRMSVEENLITGSLFGAARDRRRDSLDRVYTRFPRLRERRRQAAGTLSGGEQQLVAIGRGLMALPRLLILDEPTVGLAPLMVREVFGMIREIRNEGAAVLLAEQNVQQSLALCDRAWVLENGLVAATGTGTELTADPRVRKAFLGV